MSRRLLSKDEQHRAKYNCTHIRIFYNKGLLTRGEALDLLEIINNYFDFEVNESANEAFLDGEL